MTSLVRYYSPLDRVFDRAFAALLPAVNGGAALTARSVQLDVVETPEAYVVKAELPGVAKDKIDVNVEERDVTISVEFPEEAEANGKALWKERRYGKASRVIRLPEAVDSNAAQAKAESILTWFMSQLGQLRKVLWTDIDAAYEGDPAAVSYEEIISSYPGLEAIAIQRMAHLLYEKEVPEVAAPNPPQLVPPTNFGIDKSGSKVRGQKLKLSKTGRTGTADTIEVALNCQLQNLPFMIEPNSALRIVGLNEEFSKAYEQMGAPIQVEHARNSKNSRLAWPDPDQVDRLIRKGQREDTFASIVR